MVKFHLEELKVVPISVLILYGQRLVLRLCLKTKGMERLIWFHQNSGGGLEAYFRTAGPGLVNMDVSDVV